MSRSSRPPDPRRLALRIRARRLRRSVVVGSVGVCATLAGVVAGQAGHTAAAAATRRDPPQIASSSVATPSHARHSSQAREDSDGYFDSDGSSLGSGSSGQPAVGSTHAS